jgi:hypothetical protein
MLEVSRLTLALVVTAVPAASLVAQAPPTLAPARQAIWTEVRAFNDSMEAAFNRGDLKAVAQYADNARLRGRDGGEIRGRSSIDSYWTGIRNPVRWRLEVLDVGGHIGR